MTSHARWHWMMLPPKWSRTHSIITALTALWTLLLITEIQRPSLWIDEKISIDIATAASPAQVIANVIQGERRPPAYHLGLWAWMRLLGNAEHTARLYSVVWTIPLMPAIFQLTRRLANKHSAWLATLVAASSPVLIAYGQTVRYYCMVATLSALSYALFWDLMNQSRKPWAAYLLVNIALLYCDYPAYGVLVAQMVLAMIWWRSPSHALHHPRWVWLGVQAGLAILAAMWIPAVLAQGQRDFGAADLSDSPIGAVLRVAYPFYAWTVGENLFPWSPFAMFGLLISGGLIIYGFIRIRQYSNQLTWLVAFVLPFVMSQALLATVATDSPFVNAPARSMASAALLYTLLGVGIAALRWKGLQYVTLFGLTAVHGLGLFNYYRGTDFINSVYNTPAREVAQTIARQATPGDAIISESDSLVEYYLPPSHRASHFYPQQVIEIEAYLATHPQTTVWQVTMGRDRTRNDVSSNLTDRLKTRYTLCSSIGFAEQDATYRTLKSRLIGREVYRFRLTLDKYCP